MSVAEPKASSLKRPVMIAAAVVLLAGIAVHLALQFDDVRQLSRLSLVVLAGTVALLFGSQLAQNESMLVPLRTHLPRLGFWELFFVRTGGLVVGLAVPVAGGVAVRLAYLKRQGLTVRGLRARHSAQQCPRPGRGGLSRAVGDRSLVGDGRRRPDRRTRT